MKLLAVAVLVLATTGCTAQQAPVNIAVELYKGCLVGFTQAYGFPKSKQAIIDQASELDDTCAAWTYAWLPPFQQIQESPDNRLQGRAYTRHFKMSISLLYLLISQFIVAYLGYKSASITIRKRKPTTALSMVILGFISLAGAVAVMVIW